MLLEHHSHPLLPTRDFARRQGRYSAGACLIILSALVLGIVGYHLTESLPWVDSLLEASMILSGMGPVHNPQTTGGKLFASAYALFSGVMFLSSVAIIFTPIVHRLLHKFHLDLEERERRQEAIEQRRANTK